jgi:hypothetical protein
VFPVPIVEDCAVPPPEPPFNPELFESLPPPPPPAEVDDEKIESLPLPPFDASEVAPAPPAPTVTVNVPVVIDCVENDLNPPAPPPPPHLPPPPPPATTRKSIVSPVGADSTINEFRLLNV